MNFYDYFETDDDIKDIQLTAALSLCQMGFKVLPCEGKIPSPKIKRVNALRVKPLNEKNIPFYFSQSCNVAILTGDQLEVIDIDTKYDLTAKLYGQLSAAIEYTLPSVWEKLVIQRSASGGYHFFYKCTQIAGNKTLAQRYATNEEKAKGERLKVLVETRGEGGYIMVCPTPDYQFIQGNPSLIDFITPDERAELLAICRSFNKIDKIELPGIGDKQRTDPEAPWNVFNSKNNWEFIRDRLAQAGWEIGDDRDDRIFVNRPGSTSKSSGSIWKEKNFLYIFSTSTEFPEMKPLSAFDVVKYLQYDGNFFDAAKGLCEIGYGTWKKEDGEFHEVSVQGKVKPKLRMIIDWLNDVGIRRYFINDIEFQLVHLSENKVKIIDLNYVKKLFCDYVKQSCSSDIDDFFLSKFTSIFTKEGVINLIEHLPDNFIKHTPSESFLFFANTAIKITAQEIRFVEYSSLPGYIWQKNIVDRVVTPDITDCDAKKFIHLISNTRTNAFCSCLGYLLHPFKDPSNPRVVILNDEFFDMDKEREPQGGTGKGMVIQMLSKFKNTVIIDGKTFAFTKSFMYQRVGPDTEIVAFEDVKKGFDFEKLFSVITDGWTIEKKGMTEFTLPFEKSAKILITSNYPIRGSSSSHMRRRYELELAPYFNHLHTIKKEFNRLFFNDWDAAEWNRFDNFMIQCLQDYIADGLPEQAFVNLAASKLIEETNLDFINWIEGVTLPAEKVKKDDFLKKFTDLFPDYASGKYQVTQTRFTQWLRKWCEFKNIRLDSQHSFNGSMVYGFDTSAKNDAIIGRFSGVDLKTENPTTENEKSTQAGWMPALDDDEGF